MGKPGPKRTVTDEAILRSIALAPAPIATVKDIQADISMSRAGINNRLTQLEEGGMIESRRVGASAKVYWLTTAGRKMASNA